MGKHRQPRGRRWSAIGSKERLECECCGKPLLQWIGAGGRRTTCGSRCRQKLYRQRKMVKKSLKNFSGVTGKIGPKAGLELAQLVLCLELGFQSNVR